MKSARKKTSGVMAGVSVVTVKAPGAKGQPGSSRVQKRKIGELQ